MPKQPEQYKPRILSLDIERAPSLGTFWDQGKQYVSADQMLEESYVLTWQAKWQHGSWHHGNLNAEGHDKIIRRIHALIGKADIVVGWYTDGFDLKVLNKEYLLLGLTPPAPYKSVDLWKTAHNTFKFLSNSLDHVAKTMGCPFRKLPHDKEMWLRCMGILKDRPIERAFRDMLRYNKRDVELVDWILPQFLPYIKGLPNMNLYIPDSRGKRICPKCLSTRLRKHDSRPVNNTVRDRYVCIACGGWSYWMPSNKIMRSI